MTPFLLILKCFRKTGRNFRKFHFFNMHNKHIFCKIQKKFCLVYLQHYKDQLEVVIWVKDHFRKGLCQKNTQYFGIFHQKSAVELPGIPRHSNL